MQFGFDATGIDLIYRDGNTWFMNAVENLLYRTDLGTLRETITTRFGVVKLSP